MKINLSDTWRIETVRRNFVLKHVKLTTGTGRNKGALRMITVDEGGYTNLKRALEKFEERLIEDGTEHFEGNIDDYISTIKNILDAAVEKMLKGIETWEKDT